MSSSVFTLRFGALGIVRGRLKPGAEAAARILKDSIVEVMEEAPPRSGRTYFVPGTKQTYVASAEGEAPAIREARYVNAWDSTKGVETPRGVVAAAVNPLMAGGTPLGIVLDEQMNRPHLREGMRAAVPRINALLGRMAG